MSFEILGGNELIIQGALEAGFSLYTGYPGSPLADYFNILNARKDELQERGIKVVIANSEANAAAMASGAKQAGRDCLVAMKSMGLHVASDALSVGNFADPGEAGVVIVVGDDPWSISTSTPADSRYLFKHLHIPFLEPSNPQELKDWMGVALEISKESSVYQGVLLTTFMAEGGGRVELRDTKEIDQEKTYLNPKEFDLSRNVMVPPNSLKADTRMIEERFPRAIEALEKKALDRVFGDATQKLGVISSGVIFETAKQVLEDLDAFGVTSLYKVACSFPLIEKQLLPWLQGKDKVIVVEEKRGFLESAISELSQKHGLNLQIIGKKDSAGDLFPAFGGLTYETIYAGLSKHLSMQPKNCELVQTDLALPKRLPTFCPGCPHRETLSLLKDLRRTFEKKDVDLISHGDVGCYSLSFLPPFKEMHNLSAMGQGGALGAGVDLFTKNPSVVLMGDSTFFHSGLTDISNSLQCGHNITYILLDNDNTAMTGHQMTPASGINVEGSSRPRQDMLKVVNSLGVDYAVEVNPSDRYFYKNLLEEVVERKGVKVIVSNKECALTYHGRKKREDRKTLSKGVMSEKTFYQINTDACEDCRMCVEETGCPGLTQVFDAYGSKVSIDPQICVNDSYCTKIKVCPSFEKVTVSDYHPSKYQGREEQSLDLSNIPEPKVYKSFDAIAGGDPLRVVVTGVGGSGVTTISRVIAEASKNMGGRSDLDFKFVDQKGLAQRNGNVTAHLVIHSKDQSQGAVSPLGSADLLVSPDLLDGSTHTRFLSPDGQLILDQKFQVPLSVLLDSEVEGESLKEKELRSSLKDKFKERVHFYSFKDISYEYFGKSVYASAMCLGASFQQGALPFSLTDMMQALERSIPKSELENNQKAFQLGRYLTLNEENALSLVTKKEKNLEGALIKSLKESLLWYQNKDYVLNGFDKSLKKLVSLYPNERRDYLARFLHDIYLYDRGLYVENFLRDAGEIKEKYQDQKLRFRALQVVAKTYFVKDEVFVAHVMISPLKRERDLERFGKIGTSFKVSYINRPSFDFGDKKIEFDISPKRWMLKTMRHMRLLRLILPSWHKKEKQIALNIREKVLVDIPRLDSDRRWSALQTLQNVKGFREVRYEKASSTGVL